MALWLTLLGYALKISVALCIIVSIKLIYKAAWEWMNMPPGPWGLPLIGYLPFFPTPYNTGRHFRDLQKKYPGDSLMINVGEHTTVILNSYEAIEEASRHPQMQGRPSGRLERILKEAGQDGVFTASGASWVFTRRIAMKAVSMFTTSRSSKMSQACDVVSKWLIEKFDKDGEPVETATTLYKAVGGITGSMIFGFDPDPSHDFLTKITEMEEEAENIMGQGSMIVMFFPSLEFLDRKQERREKEAMTKIMDYIRSWTTNYKPSPNGEIRNIMDSLDKVVKEVPEEEKRRRQTTDERIKAIIFDLFQAGTGSIQEGLVWTFLTLSRFPDVQKRAQEEIDHYCGDSFPTLENDHPNLVYVRCILHESWRWITNWIFDGNQKTATEDIYFRGNFLKKGTPIWANATAIHFDPEIFAEPELFKPERFMQADGSFNAALSNKVMAFGMGARRCIGETFTLQFTVILLASILQAFKILPDPYQKGDPLREVDQFGFGYMPANHKLIFQRRKKN